MLNTHCVCCLGNVGYMQFMVFLLLCILHPTVKKKKRHLCMCDFIPLDQELIYSVLLSAVEHWWCEGKVHEVTFCSVFPLMFTEGRFAGKAKTLGLGLCVCSAHWYANQTGDWSSSFGRLTLFNGNACKWHYFFAAILETSLLFGVKLFFVFLFFCIGQPVSSVFF